ncbi:MULTISPECIES: aminoglycoside phosphotransferase family protein [Kitasatospora]|uniref:aminoglycoside phosphotransferase family protein n=1 Tax=Kitasatospora TaxID=2063 RepID=UPI000C713457|nr:aminoglycoside phosphotransferase family protein [Kitasatospora sp. GP30]MDH6139336.1 aminoglycoside phosphotransferase (APT) family kinase protein [Kitasatospora sp. GP30]
MTSRRPEPTCAEVEQACVQGRLITRGPLNDTYEAELRGRRVFVRHRTTDDPEYGQTFAAERHVAPLLDGALRIPRVIQVVPDAGGRERYAVFEFVPGTPPDWTSRPVLRELADALLRVHRIAGSGFGSVGAAPQRRPAAALLADLIRAEAHRLPDGPERDRLGGSTVESAAHCFRGELPTLCHGDVHAGNFRTDRAGRFWVLDWEAARYRVPAADFNQLHDHWLSGGRQRVVLERYLERSGRDPLVFTRQIRLLRLLWHLRTYNFHTLVRGEPTAAHRRHLDAAMRLSRATGRAAGIREKVRSAT